MQHFVEPDDETNRTRETGQHLIDYLKYYKKNPTYIETDDQTKRNIRNQLNKKIPLPGYARKTIQMAKQQLTSQSPSGKKDGIFGEKKKTKFDVKEPKF